MLSFLDRLGLPIKYAFIGFLIAIIWLVFSQVVGYDTGLGWPATILAFVIGGYFGGWIRQSMGEDN